MKKLFALLVLAFAPDATAQCYPTTADLIPFAKESLTVSSSALGLTAATYTNAASAIMTVGAQPIRVWFDGSTPTSTVGHYFVANTQITVCGVTISRIRFILDTGAGGDATLSVTYSRPPQ